MSADALAPKLRSYVEAGGARVLLLAARVVLPPLLLASVGAPAMGLWALCFVLLGSIGAQGVGLTPWVVTAVSRAWRGGDGASLSRRASQGVVVLGLAWLALTALAALTVPDLVALVGVPPEQRATAQGLFCAALALFVFDGTLGAFMSLLPAIGRDRLQTRLWLAAVALETVLAVALLLAGAGLWGLMAAFAVRQLVMALAVLRALARALPGLRIVPRWPEAGEWRQWRAALSLQPLVSLLEVVGQSADRWLAALWLGPAAVAWFDLGGKFSIAALAVPAAMAALLLPACSAAMARADHHAASTELQRGLGLVVAACALIYPLFGALGAPLSLLWLGNAPEREVVAALMLPMALACHAQALVLPWIAYERAHGGAHAGLLHAALRPLLALGFGLVAVRLGGGAVGLAWAVAAANVVALALIVMRQRPGAALLKTMAAPTLLGHLSAAGWAALALGHTGPGRSGALLALAATALPHLAGGAALLWRARPRNAGVPAGLRVARAQP